MSKDRIRDWVMQTAEVMVDSTMTIIRECEKPVENVGLDNKLMYMFIQTLMHVMVATALTDYQRQNLTDSEQQADHTIETFLTMKREIQNAISVGFEEGWAQAHNQYVDYYVAIEQVPAPMNQEPC